MIVDAHCHVIVAEMMTGAAPASWRPELRRDTGRTDVRFRGRTLTSVTAEFSDVDEMLGEAAAQGIDHLMLSPWIMLVPAEGDVSEAAAVCRLQNAALSAATVGRPVSALGAVPLHDPVAAAAMLRELMALPGLHGAEVPASVAGACLGDDRFLPFWEAAADTGALIFVHPTTRGLGIGALNSCYLWNSVGNPVETAITAAHLVAAGVLERFSGLAVLLAHGGGALHAVRGRLRRAFAVRAEARSRCRAGPDESLRQLYYDSLTHDAAMLADLIGFVGTEHVLLGSDRPFDMGADDPVGDIMALGLGPGAGLVLGGNASRLLGLGESRLTARGPAGLGAPGGAGGE